MIRHIPFAEWADLMHARSNPWKVMTPLRSYFDESGLHAEANVTVIAGFVADKDRWTRLEADWVAKLAERDLPYFHMTECVTGHSVFSRWADNPEIRAFLISEFAAIDLPCFFGPI